MHNQPYVGRIALCTRKKLLKSGEIRHFYGMSRITKISSFSIEYSVSIFCRMNHVVYQPSEISDLLMYVGFATEA